MDAISHDELFSEVPLKLGKALWYILKGNIELDRRMYVSTLNGRGVVHLTSFGKEVGRDEIHWWVFKKDPNVQELKERTKHALESVQKLKEHAEILDRVEPDEYKDIISTLKDFALSHINEIEALYDYAYWLFDRDVLAPCILFTYRVWGSTRISDRFIEVEADSPESESLQLIYLLTEIAFGLNKHGFYILNSVIADFSYDEYERDPESYRSRDNDYINDPRVIRRAYIKVIKEFSLFFELIRNSMRNVVLEIDKYSEQKRLMKSESFWRLFIEKAKTHTVAEPQLWDFKKTLDIWHITDRSRKADKEVQLCETIASFANNRGGVLLIGISDSPPRQIYSIGDNVGQIERRLHYLSNVITNRIRYDRDIVALQQVSVPDISGSDNICLVIIIGQTEAAVAVVDEQGKFSYPIRQTSGLDRVELSLIQNRKRHIDSDNFDFITELNQYVHDR